MSASGHHPPAGQTPLPGLVADAFVRGEEAAEGEWRSACRQHDTEGGMLVLFGGSAPRAARWERPGGVRIDVLNSIAPTPAP